LELNAVLAALNNVGMPLDLLLWISMRTHVVDICLCPLRMSCRV
jgi:hypothetical protein